jgi:hypothetical protein
MEVGRKQDRKSIEKVLGLHLQRESHRQGASERGSEEGEQGSWMCVGNRRENVGRRVREENDDVREHGGERADVRSRDMGMEGTGGGGESAREIFEMRARSGQRNTRVHSEGRVQEEQAESESGKESGKVRGQNGRKGRVQDTD